MDVTLLGTSGWMPSDRRETTCVACRHGDALLVFDAGTGLRRLLSPLGAGLLRGAASVHVFLSHYHLDHTCGLAYLPGVLPDRDVVFHPPSAAITGIDPHRALAELVRKPYNPTDWDDMRRLSIEPLEEGLNVIAGLEVRVRPQMHSDTSVAFRVGDAFALSTDTPDDPDSAAFFEGVSLLIHEAWYNAADPRSAQVPTSLRPGYASHSEVTAVAGLAAAASAGRLVLAHLNPLHGEDYYAAMAETARGVFPACLVCDDGDSLDTAGVV